MYTSRGPRTSPCPPSAPARGTVGKGTPAGNGVRGMLTLIVGSRRLRVPSTFVWLELDRHVPPSRHLVLQQRGRVHLAKRQRDSSKALAHPFLVRCSSRPRQRGAN